MWRVGLCQQLAIGVLGAPALLIVSHLTPLTVVSGGWTGIACAAGSMIIGTTAGLAWQAKAA